MNVGMKFSIALVKYNVMYVNLNGISQFVKVKGTSFSQESVKRKMLSGVSRYTFSAGY